MSSLDGKWKYGITAVLVTAFLMLRLPLLNDHVYPQYHSRVAISHIIIAQEFIDHGLQIFTYQTYCESTAGADLFAITGSPLVSLFGPTGLRVWELLLTGIATVLIGICTVRWFGRWCGLIVCTVMVFSPMVVYLGTAVFPEAFHLTATVAAVAAYIQTTRHNYRILWTFVASVCVVAATADHLWGAYILAPLGVLTIQHRNWLDGAAFVAAAGIDLLIVQFAQSELSDGQSLIVRPPDAIACPQGH